MTKTINLLTSGYNAKIIDYKNNKEKKIKDLELKERTFEITFKSNEFYYRITSAANKIGSSINLNKKRKEFIYFAGNGNVQHFVMTDDSFKVLEDTIFSIENEYFNNIEIDINTKHYFDLSFGNFGAYALSKTFNDELKDKLCKELNITRDELSNASRFICKYSKEKNGLTYNEIKEVIKMYQNHVSKTYQDMYDYIQTKKTIKELKDEGNDGLADLEELYSDLNENNFKLFEI